MLFKFSFFFDFLPVVLFIIENNLLMSLANIIKFFLAPFNSNSFAIFLLLCLFIAMFYLVRHYSPTSILWTCFPLAL